MNVGKINYTNTDINARLQQRQQSKNLTFAGSHSLNKTILDRAPQISGEYLHSVKSLFNKTINSVKGLFMNPKKVLNLAGTTIGTPDTPGIPAKYKDFSSIKRNEFHIRLPDELDVYAPISIFANSRFFPTDFSISIPYFNVATIRNGLKIQKAISVNQSPLSDIFDIHPITGKPVKHTRYWGNGNVDKVLEFTSTGNKIKESRFDTSGRAYSVDRFDPITGNLVKNTQLYSNGKPRYITEFSPITGNKTKITVFTVHGHLGEITEFDPKTGRDVKVVKKIYIKDSDHLYVSEFNPDTRNKVVESLYYDEEGKNLWIKKEYDTKTRDLVSFTEFNTDGSVKSVENY